MNGQVENQMKSRSVPNAKAPIGIEKKCSRCETIKSSKDFYVHPKTGDGLYPYCKLCVIKQASIWHKENKKKAVKARRRWVVNNPEKSREIYRQWKRKNPIKAGQWAKNYSARKHELAKLWRMANPEKVKAMRKRAHIKIRSAPQGKLANRMSALMFYSLKGNKNGRHWESLAGYTVDDLKRHLEKHFKDGMTWDNMGLWHIDHREPVSAFNFNKPEDEDFKRCWSLKNLQPLWAMDNLKKSDKLDKHFQPGLIFG